MPVVRQGCARAASRHSAGPVRGQRPPSGEAADGGGPRAPLWGGRSGTEGSCRLRALAGVRVSQGAISQDALRRAAGAVGDAYSRLRTSVRASPFVHTDDTGWRVGGERAFLMAFAAGRGCGVPSPCSSPERRGAGGGPSDYGGVMVTDRGRSYDAQALCRGQAAEVYGARTALGQPRWFRPRQGEDAASARV